MPSQTLTLQEAFETTAQINKWLKWMEYDGAFHKKEIFLHFLLSFEN